MPNTVRLKSNTTSGVAPTSLGVGELAVNTADGRVFLQKSDGSIVRVGGNASDINTGTIPAARIGDGSITTAKLADGSVTAAKIASAQALQVGSLTSLGTVSSATTVSCSTLSAGTGGVVVGIGAIRIQALGGSNTFNVSSAGNVTTGAWQATAVAVAYGGTGATDAGTARTNLGAAAASHTHTAANITDFNTAVASAAPVTSVNGQTGAVTIASGNPTVVSLSYAATLNTNASSGSIFDVTLTGNTLIANPTNGVNGQTLRWRITQDGTGSRTVSLGNKFALPASVSSLTFSTAANKTDILAATYHATRDKWDVVALVTGY